MEILQHAKKIYIYVVTAAHFVSATTRVLAKQEIQTYMKMSQVYQIIFDIQCIHVW